LHVTVPAAVVKTDGAEEVFLIVVAPENGRFPGSSLRVVVAEADAEPSARRPSAATAASVANLRIDMKFS
jgi:hypothetical protein